MRRLNRRQLFLLALVTIAVISAGSFAAMYILSNGGSAALQQAGSPPSLDEARAFVETRSLHGLARADVLSRFGAPHIDGPKALYYKVGSTFSPLFGPEDICLVLWLEDGVVGGSSIADS